MVRKLTRRHQQPTVEEMDGFEYQRMYDTGVMPERFWPEEIEKLKVAYMKDEIGVTELEAALGDLMSV
jgi:hypothetical protein